MATEIVIIIQEKQPKLKFCGGSRSRLEAAAPHGDSGDRFLQRAVHRVQTPSLQTNHTRDYIVSIVGYRDTGISDLGLQPMPTTETH